MAERLRVVKSKPRGRKLSIIEYRWRKRIRKEATLYSISKAAEVAGVNRGSLYWAIEEGKVPHVPIIGMKGTEKAVHLKDVIKWRDSRDPAKANAGRKKSAK